MPDEAVLIKIFRYCAYQERCPQEVRRKLRDLETSPAEIEEILGRLEAEGFVDAARFARTFAGGRFRIKRWGRMKIKNELRKREIPEGLILAAFRAEIPKDAYLSTLRLLIENKNSELERFEPIDRKARLIRYLQQKGYEWDLIRAEL